MDLSNCSFEKVGVAVLVDHNYGGFGVGSRVSLANSLVVKSCQPFRKRWLAQGRLCRRKNQRATREPSALSPESRVLRIYLVCLLVADRHVVSSSRCPEGTKGRVRSLCPKSPFSTSGDQGSV